MPDTRSLPEAASVLNVSPDTIVSTVDHRMNLSPERAVELRGYKALIRASEDELEDYSLGTIPGVPGGEFRLSARSREKYQFIIKSDDWYVELSSWSNMPPARVDPSARLIAQVGYKEILRLTVLVASWCLGISVEVKDLKPSRFDLKVDFQHKGFEIPNRQDVATRAKEGDRRDESGVVTSYTYGVKSSGLQIQVYNKTAEALAKGNDWIFDAWKENPEYDRMEQTFRMELRYYRTSLRRLGVFSYEDLDKNLPGLVLLTLGLSPGSWFRVLDPTDRGKSSQDRETAVWFQDVVQKLWDEIPGIKTAEPLSWPKADPKPKMTMQRAALKVLDAVENFAAVGRACGEFSGENPVYIMRRILDLLDARSRETKTSWIQRIEKAVLKVPPQLHDRRHEWKPRGLALC